VSVTGAASPRVPSAPKAVVKADAAPFVSPPARPVAVHSEFRANSAASRDTNNGSVPEYKDAFMRLNCEEEIMIRNRVGVYIPMSEINVCAGAAIVAPLDPPDSAFRVWIESAKAGSADLQEFTQCVERAARRMMERTPTMAIRAVQPWQVLRVAVFDVETGSLMIEDADNLKSWIG
jgi:hypothetical protein